MWVKEMGDLFDMLPYYLLVCLPIFIALSPVNPVEAASGMPFIGFIIDSRSEIEPVLFFLILLHMVPGIQMYGFFYIPSIGTRVNSFLKY
jgi:hypothetical protein